jgi:hypothetical protein
VELALSDSCACWALLDRPKYRLRNACLCSTTTTREKEYSAMLCATMNKRKPRGTARERLQTPPTALSFEHVGSRFVQNADSGVVMGALDFSVSGDLRRYNEDGVAWMRSVARGRAGDRRQTRRDETRREGGSSGGLATSAAWRSPRWTAATSVSRNVSIDRAPPPEFLGPLTPPPVHAHRLFSFNQTHPVFEATQTANTSSTHFTHKPNNSQWIKSRKWQSTLAAVEKGVASANSPQCSPGVHQGWLPVCEPMHQARQGASSRPFSALRPMLTSAQKEFIKISQAVGVGFVIMGVIGYVVKLIHIPVNNILVGGS